MGVVRPTRCEDASVVRLWVVPGTGVILAADESFADHFGVEAGQLVGRGVGMLGPDIEALDRWV